MTNKIKTLGGYVIHDGELYKETENKFFKGYQKAEHVDSDIGASWKGPLIPFALWRELVAWCEVTQEKFKSEALAFLYLDADTWKIWYPPQITAGMTVKADPEHKDYNAQRKLMGDGLQLGTVHHHCTTSAFQSGTDSADEIDRDGLHFTIGNLNKRSYDIHFRLCFGGTCYEAAPEDFIGLSEEIDSVPKRFQMSIHKAMIAEATDIDHLKNYYADLFKEPLKNVSKKTYSVPRTGIGQQTKLNGYEGYYLDDYWADDFEEIKKPKDDGLGKIECFDNWNESYGYQVCSLLMEHMSEDNKLLNTYHNNRDYPSGSPEETVLIANFIDSLRPTKQKMICDEIATELTVEYGEVIHGYEVVKIMREWARMA